MGLALKGDAIELVIELTGLLHYIKIKNLL
jgi:hypothetical protein